MFIKQGYFVKDFYLYNRKSPISFTYGGPHSIKLILKQAKKIDDTHRKEDNKSICRAYGHFKTSPKIKRYFSDIAQNKLPKEISKNPEALEYLEKYAKVVEQLHIKFFPQPFKDFVGNTRSELYDVIRRTVNIFRWRYGRVGEHNPLFNGRMAFSMDGKKWNLIPHGIQMRAEPFLIQPLPNRVAINIKKFVKEGYDEPLGHELIREAISLRQNNPRIAVVVAISALEVGLKECISELVPDSKWLVQNLPSPPTTKIITEYLHKLPLKIDDPGKREPLPDHIIKTLKKGIQIRNRISHTGASAPNQDTIKEILSATQDMLWLFDYYSGHEWAFNHISEETKSYFM